MNFEKTTRTQQATTSCGCKITLYYEDRTLIDIVLDAIPADHKKIGVTLSETKK